MPSWPLAAGWLDWLAAATRLSLKYVIYCATAPPDKVGPQQVMGPGGDRFHIYRPLRRRCRIIVEVDSRPACVKHAKLSFPTAVGDTVQPALAFVMMAVAVARLTDTILWWRLVLSPIPTRTKVRLRGMFCLLFLSVVLYCPNVAH